MPAAQGGPCEDTRGLVVEQSAPCQWGHVRTPADVPGLIMLTYLIFLKKNNGPTGASGHPQMSQGVHHRQQRRVWAVSRSMIGHPTEGPPLISQAVRRPIDIGHDRASAQGPYHYRDPRGRPRGYIDQSSSTDRCHVSAGHALTDVPGRASTNPRGGISVSGHPRMTSAGVPRSPLSLWMIGRHTPSLGCPRVSRNMVPLSVDAWQMYALLCRCPRVSR